MSASLLSQGLELLLYGMGTVVLFLTLLVYATRLMSRLILRFFPEPLAPPRSSSPRPLPADDKAAPSPELLAAIAAAVHEHRAQAAARSERP